MASKRKSHDSEQHFASTANNIKRTKHDKMEEGAAEQCSTKEDARVNNAHIEYVTGDVLEAAQGSVIVHSCNCEGSWGKGFAKALRLKYPGHCKRYQIFCKTHKPAQLLGKCLLLGPAEDVGDVQDVWIACLFTRKNIFRGSTKATSQAANGVVDATKTSMSDLYRQMQAQNLNRSLAMPKINSGLFQTPWQRTADALQSVPVPKGIPSLVQVFEID
ncbi:MAG: ADP-ribose 1''-phosphate phosphatase [Chrysothrix sp. TS-e1954]|nr:MAG: ADP-ribose 1''-phosphate phosphatase [Chrysothrix sp. TS-e1954]